MTDYGTSLVLTDRMTPILTNIINAMNMTISAARDMKSEVSKGFDSNTLDAVNASLSEASVQLEQLAEDQRRINDGIRDSASNQRRFNDELTKAPSQAGQLLNRIKQIAGAYVGVQGAKKLLDLSDENVGYEARISLIADPASVERIKQQAFLAAQNSRGDYSAMLNSVSRMGLLAGQAFRDPLDDTKTDMNQIIRFQELMNKNFVIGGASAGEQASAMYQLTQAMASGRLQGDEYRSIIENAPLLAQSIEDYMQNVVGATGTMKEWASEGKLTSDVIKAAVFSSADEIEERFANMPMTWSQVFTSAANEMKYLLDPVLKKINEIANSDDIKPIVARTRNAFAVISTIATSVIGAIANGAGFIARNWDVIAPIVLGVGSAILAVVSAKAAYNAVQAIGNGIEMAGNFISAITTAYYAKKSGLSLANTAAIKLETGAQIGLNAAIMACPLTWIILAIIAVITVIALVIAWLKKTGVVTNSVLGIIMGGLNVAWEFIKNLGLSIANSALGIWEALKAVCENIKTAFWNSIYSVQGFFFDLVSTVLSCVAKIANALNKIPFVEFDVSGLENAANEYASKADAARGKKGEYVSLSDAYEKGSSRFETFQAGWAADAYVAGAAKGDEWTDKIKDKFSLNTDSGEGEGFSNYSDLLGSIDANTAEINNSVSSRGEDELKYLRMLAERETINRYTTAQINLEMHSEATINSDTDIDGYFNELTEELRDQLLVTAEGL